jgi:thioesterase domain-containing protein
MMNAATKVELIKKIASLPDSLPDEGDEHIAEILDLLAEIDNILNTIHQHEEQRAKNWQTTVQAMQDIERGEFKTFATVEELMADLHADD